MATRRMATHLALLASAAGAMVGCAGDGGSTASLEPEDFRGGEAEAAAVIENAGDAETTSEEVRTSLLDPATQEIRTIDAETARAGIDDVEVLTGPPAPAPARPTRVAPTQSEDLDPETDAQIAEILASAEDRQPAAPAPDEGRAPTIPVDAMVGHINGRPLFASEFFEPMEQRLIAEAERMSPEQWLRFAREQVQIALRDRIRDELLLAELESSLSPQERTGLLSFVGRLRENLISQNRGSESLANERLLAEEGVTLDEKVFQERNRELIRVQLQRAVGNRVFVSWREVQQAYEREKDLLDPPPVARLRMVWAADDQAAAEIEQRLEAGEDFEAIATDASVNVYQANAGGLRTVSLRDDAPYEANDFFAPEALNEAARSLEIGQTLGPLEYSGRAVWLHLEAIDDEGMSLYEAQLQLYTALMSQRFNEAQTEYFTRLIARGSLSDIEQMERRLFQLAAERYLFDHRQ